MKKIAIALLALLIFSSFSACNEGGTNVINNGTTTTDTTSATTNDVSALIKSTPKFILKEATEYKADKKGSTIKMTFNGTEYDLGYLESVKDYYADRDRYYFNDGKEEITVEKDPVSGRLVCYRWVFPADYIAENKEKNTPELSRDECLELAKNFFADNFSGAEEYILKSESYPPNSKTYSFTFAKRNDDGLKTFDEPKVAVTVYGDVKIFIHYYPCDLTDIPELTEEEIEKMKADVIEEVNDKYRSYIDRSRYTRTDITDYFLVRDKDGKWGVQFNTTFGYQITYDEVASMKDCLIVYLD